MSESILKEIIKGLIGKTYSEKVKHLAELEQKYNAEIKFVIKKDEVIEIKK